MIETQIDHSNHFIDVIYALPNHQFVRSVPLYENDTFLSIIERSEFLSVYDDLNLESLNFGSYGKIKKLTDVVTKYDRVEIYRDIVADPRSVVRRSSNKVIID